jgi:hypothetical protein
MTWTWAERLFAGRERLSIIVWLYGIVMPLSIFLFVFVTAELLGIGSFYIGFKPGLVWAYQLGEASGYLAFLICVPYFALWLFLLARNFNGHHRLVWRVIAIVYCVIPISFIAKVVKLLMG